MSSNRVHHSAPDPFFVFLIIWFGIGGILTFRMWSTQRAYLRRLPPVDGVPVEQYVHQYLLPTRDIWSLLFQAAFEVQADPEAERLRREMWRRMLYLVIWVFGFPVFGCGLLVALTVANPLSNIAVAAGPVLVSRQGLHSQKHLHSYRSTHRRSEVHPAVKTGKCGGGRETALLSC